MINLNLNDKQTSFLESLLDLALKTDGLRIMPATVDFYNIIVAAKEKAAVTASAPGAGPQITKNPGVDRSSPTQ